MKRQAAMGKGAPRPPLAEGCTVTWETMASACERVENASSQARLQRAPAHGGLRPREG